MPCRSHLHDLVNLMTTRKTRPTTFNAPFVSGRVVEDDRGNSIWEHKTETGDYSRNVDTQRVLKALHNDELALDGGVGKNAAPTGNPYDFNPFDKTAETPAAQQPRKSLDDMRKLSEQIKQLKKQGGPGK